MKVIEVSKYTQLRIKSIINNNCIIDVCTKKEGKKKVNTCPSERDIHSDSTGKYIIYGSKKYYI